MMPAVPDHSRSARGEVVRRPLGAISLRLLIEPPGAAAASACPSSASASSPAARASSPASPSSGPAAGASARAAPCSAPAGGAAASATPAPSRAAACRGCSGSGESQAKDEDAAGQRRSKPLGGRSR